MRYFGGQTKKIEQITHAYFSSNPKARHFLDGGFCDPFSGSGVVAQSFSNLGVKTITGDYAKFAYYLTSYSTAFDVHKLEQISDELNQSLIDVGSTEKADTDFERNFVQNYAVNMPYFVKKNARRIVKYRLLLEDMLLSGSISNAQFDALMGSLLYSILKVANIRLMFDGPLSGVDEQPILLLSRFPENNKQPVSVFCQDYKVTVDNFSGGVLYLNPPSLKKDYVHYYHLLDTVIQMREGQIVDKSGRYLHFKKENPVSVWGKASTARDAFYDLLLNNRARYIVMTYNKNGIIPLDDIRSGFLRNGIQRTFKEVDLGNEVLFAIEGGA